MLLTHLMRLAVSFARANAGNNMLARLAMIAITTSNPISVNPAAALPAPSISWIGRSLRFRFISFARINICIPASTLSAYDEETLDAYRNGHRARRHLALL